MIITIEIMRITCVILGPVFSVRYIVKVPAGGKHGRVAHFSDLG